MQGGASTASLGQSEVPRVVSLSQQWRTGAHPASFAIPASFVDSTCTGPRRTGAHPTQHGAFRVEFRCVCRDSCRICCRIAYGFLRVVRDHPCVSTADAVAKKIECPCLLFRKRGVLLSIPRLQPIRGSAHATPLDGLKLTTYPAPLTTTFGAATEVGMEVRVGCVLFSLSTARYGSSASFRTAPPGGGPALTRMLLEVEERNWCCALAGLTLVEAAP